MYPHPPDYLEFWVKAINYINMLFKWIHYVFIFLWRCLIIAKEKEMPINGQIRVKQMLVIGPNGEQLGIKSKEEALIDFSKYSKENAIDFIKTMLSISNTMDSLAQLRPRVGSSYNMGILSLNSTIKIV